MSGVGQEPAVRKTNHYFDPESLEDLTACVPIHVLREELAESQEGIITDTYDVLGHRLGREHEDELRAFAHDPVNYIHYESHLLSITGTLTDEEHYDLGRVKDRIREIDFTLGAISVRPLLTQPEEVTEAAAEASQSFSLTLSALFTNNPAAEYVVAVIQNRGLTGGDTALGVS